MENSADLGRIINKTHVDRLEGYLKEKHNGKVLAGGDVYHDKMFIQPTIIDQPDLTSSLMTEEIFGPILPVVEYSDLGELIKLINSRPKPLAVYCFSENSDVVN